MPRVFGAKPRPRVLVLGLGDQGDLREQLALLAPTVEFATLDVLQNDINQREWDLVVLWRCDAEIQEGLGVVQFGGFSASPLRQASSTFSGLHHKTEVSRTYVPTDQAPQVQQLVGALAEQLVAAGRCAVMSISTSGVKSVIVPFLLNANGRPVAGAYMRGDRSAAEWWWLPGDCPDPDKWVGAALARFREVNPERFEPTVTDWLTDPRWQTMEERAANKELSDIEARHAEAVRVLREDRAAALARGRQAAERADVAERRLLTAKGDELKNEVAAALRELGFEVSDADVEHAVKGDLLEDLRVTDPGEPGWIALAEVRGYSGGAKLSDLLRIGRFVTRYTTAEGTPPSASWYVVNQFLATDPSTRAEPLASNAEEVEVFAEGGGLVVHTTTLFRLRERVRAGDLDGADARVLLRSPGRLELGDIDGTRARGPGVTGELLGSPTTGVNDS